MGDIKNLTASEAVEKIRALAKDQTTMLCTFVGPDVMARPMATQGIDEDGTFWFFSKRDSNKNRHIAQNNKVQLIYANNGSAEYLSIEGTATVERDQAKINELWSGWAKTWFTEGKEDPALTLIKFTPAAGYYWDTKHNKMVSLAKIAVGAVIGKTMDDGVEGELNL